MRITDVKFIKTTSKKVKARADIHFDWFLLKGFKIIWDEKKKKNYVTPPSYMAGRYWRELFRTDYPEDWDEIQRKALEAFDFYEMEESVNESTKNKHDRDI
jgi:hypothetical protein